MGKVVLEVKNIKKDYKVGDTYVHALKGVDLQFRQNEFVSILGASGCGKTTFLNIIGGLDRYTSGDLIIKGVSTKDFKDSDWDAYRNYSIGFVFQSYNLISHQNILRNVELALTLSGVSPQERHERAAEALRRVGLGEDLHKFPNQLSGGQMQRVAIARALVNNPEILLADEPTGALDTKTSVQIMDLIKEIAGERLVIMVTHNPELAKQYSTRIIELKDGVKVSDSNPITEEELVQSEQNSTENSESPELRQDATVGAESSEPKQDVEQASALETPKKKKRKKRFGTGMSFSSALTLSGRNLWMKKARTIVTSIAGSIGIISVCLVLALSNGFSNYIKKTEEDMLSYYPLNVAEMSLDPTEIMMGFMKSGDMPDLSELDNKVYVNSFLTQIAQGMVMSNDISQKGYVDYIYDMDPSLYYALQKKYGTKLTDNLFTTVSTGIGEEEKQEVRSLASLKEYFISVLEKQEEKYADLAYLVDYLGPVVSKMPGTSRFDKDRGEYSEYILAQYDVLKGSFPKDSNEAVLVVGKNNNLTDLLLAQLGYVGEQTFLDLFELSGGNAETISEQEYLSYTFDELCAKPYTLYYNDAIYEKQPALADYPFEYNGNHGIGGEELLGTNDGKDGIEIKISGILRLKDGLTYGCLSPGLNVTDSLVEEFIQKNMQSEIVKWMNESFPSGGKIDVGGATYYRSPAEHLNKGNYSRINKEQLEGMNPSIAAKIEGMYFTNDFGQDRALRSLGGKDAPNAILIFPRDFESKDSVTDYLTQWNTNAENTRKEYIQQHGSADGYEGPSEVTYTDTVGLMMEMVQRMLNIVTYVLIAFTGISLVVSTVMIGVITYVSVVERTKEIGILRAVGARKKDIKRVFNAETFIIGLGAGVIGIGVAYLIQGIINLILTPLTGVAGLAALRWFDALTMVIVSILLTLCSGLLPASAAAKRDPVIALRSE